jgi:hypothetical protein
VVQAILVAELNGARSAKPTHVAGVRIREPLKQTNLLYALYRATHRSMTHDTCCASTSFSISGEAGVSCASGLVCTVAARVWWAAAAAAACATPALCAYAWVSQRVTEHVLTFQAPWGGTEVAPSCDADWQDIAPRAMGQCGEWRSVAIRVQVAEPT